MKAITFLLLVICFTNVTAQQKSSTISLAGGIKLTGVIENFNVSKHKIDTCRDEFSNKYICRIDGKKWYGSDQGLELPRNQLNKLTIYINKQPIALNCSGMFNPVYAYEFDPQQFELKNKGNNYYLFGFFSDGAGTYTAHWKISDGKSTRVKISNDEEDFSWHVQ